MNELPRVAVIIPTYNREDVLIQTINNLLSLRHRACEILVVDQTEQHSESVDASLRAMHENGDIQWVKLARPSISNAMNVGALKAVHDIVLFVDDDIQVNCELVYEHAIEYLDEGIHDVAGQVIQSWESALTREMSSFRNDHRHDPDAFRFNSSNSTEVKRFISRTLVQSLVGFIRHPSRSTTARHWLWHEFFLGHFPDRWVSVASLEKRIETTEPLQFLRHRLSWPVRENQRIWPGRINHHWLAIENVVASHPGRDKAWDKSDFARGIQCEETPTFACALATSNFTGAIQCVSRYWNQQQAFLPKQWGSPAGDL